MLLGQIGRGAAIALVFLVAPTLSVQAQDSVLSRYKSRIEPAELVEGASAFGAVRDDLPVAPLMQDAKEIGFVFVTSDFVGTTGYSGKPIHTMVAVDHDARILGIDLVKHSEQNVLIGIPDSKIKAMVSGYRGLDLVAEAEARGSSHDLNIISGATVTVMVIDDSIVRAGLKVARALGLGGLSQAENTGPKFEINAEATSPESWI